MLSIQPYSAIVLGSTGNVGQEIVKLLAANSVIRQVVVINRRQTGNFNGFPKVREVVVPDMDRLTEAVDSAARDSSATVAFCAIGVGKGTRKMPEAELRKVEVQYPEAFAKGCKAGGVLALGLMSAAGVDSDSSIKYVRIIGQKEQVVTEVGIQTLGVYQPSVILGNSNTPSYLNYVFPAVQWFLPSRYHAIHKNELARAMVEGTQQALVELQEKLSAGREPPRPEVRFYEYREMKPLFSR